MGHHSDTGRCLEYERLETEALATLKKINELSAESIQAFEQGNAAVFSGLDREMELTLGHKERIIGALREHAASHGCQRAFMPDL